MRKSLLFSLLIVVLAASVSFADITRETFPLEREDVKLHLEHFNLRHVLPSFKIHR